MSPTIYVSGKLPWSLPILIFAYARCLTLGVDNQTSQTRQISMASPTLYSKDKV